MTAQARDDARVYLAGLIEAKTHSRRHLADVLDVDHGLLGRFIEGKTLKGDNAARITERVHAWRSGVRQATPQSADFRDGVLYSIEQYAELIARLARGARGASPDEGSAAGDEGPPPLRPHGEQGPRRAAGRQREDG
jgi:hypothetical protein